MNEPCRLCGSEPTLANYYDFYRFHCPTPGCKEHMGDWKAYSGKGKWYGSIDGARDAWDKRQKRGEATSAQKAAEPEPEPAVEENEPQDGSECDTREQLEADIRRAYWCLSEQEIEPVFGWLDRQAAITEREVLCQPDERDEQIAELTAERDNWANCYDMAVKRGQNLLSKIDELTAERDKLKAKLETYGKVPDQDEREESQPVESGDTRENLEVDMFYAVTRLWNEAYKLGSRNGVGGFKIDEPFYKLLDRQAAITEHNCRMEYEDMRDYLQARVDSLTAEHDELERANSRQARKIHDVCELNEKLTAENKRLRVEWESERDFADQCETRAKELAAERDHLREVVKAQADSFAKLERELHDAKVEAKHSRDGVERLTEKCQAQREELAKLNAEKRGKRRLPKHVAWPRHDDGKLVKLNGLDASSVAFTSGSCLVKYHDGSDEFFDMKELRRRWKERK